MSETSSRLGLPYLVTGQAQKDVTHNEALALIDAGIFPCGQSCGSNTPPGAPEVGMCFIVGDAPTGVWTGRPGALAAFTDGGWRFLPPVEGQRVWLADQKLWAFRNESAWTIGEECAASLIIGGLQVVGSRLDPVDLPSGGSIVDAEARAAVAAVIERLQAHGLIDAG